MKYSDKKTKRLLIATSAVTLGMLAGGFAVLGGEKAAAETPKIPDGCEISVQDGTSLKLNEKGGLRFIFKMNTAMKKYIVDNDTADNVKLIAHVGPAASVATQNVSRTIDEEKLYQISGDESWYANVCLVSVLEKNYSLEYTAQAFLEIGGTKVQASAINDKARGSFYDVATRALLDVTEDYAESILNLSSYSWLGTEAHPLYIDSLDLYNGLVAKINDGLDFSEKYVAIRSSVNVESGTALNEGKTLPANNYKLSRVTFRDGKNELGSVIVKNGEQATFASPEDKTDGEDKLVFETWVTKEGGETAADLNAITGDITVYAKYRRVHANAITAFNTADLVYGETPAFAATAKYGEAAITYSKTKDGEYKAWAELENHDAGKYFAKASVAATAGYSAAEQIVEFNVNKATNSISITMPKTIKCTDTPEPTSATVQHGTIKYTYGKDFDKDQVHAFEIVKYKDDSGNEIVDSGFGYKIKAAVEGTNNYEGAEQVAEFTVTHDFDENGLCKDCRKGQSCIGYTEDGDRAYISDYRDSWNPSGEIYPLSVYNGKPVTYVKADLFSGKNITKAVLPESVKSLDGGVFANCSKLEFVSMTGVENLVYDGSSLGYGSVRGNNFINCTALKYVILNANFTTNCQQFFLNGSTPEKTILDIYVNAASGTPDLGGNGVNTNLWTGKVFYKGDAAKCLQWTFNENGEIIHGAGEHNYVDGKCTRCGEYNAMGVTYKYDENSGTYYVAGYTGTNATVNVLGTWNDGTNGEKQVTFIKYRAFDGNKIIKRVILHENITSLDGGVFANCPNLEYVSMIGITNLKITTLQELPHKSIYGTTNDYTNHNFMNCPKLTTVVVGKNFTVGDAMFMSTQGDTAHVNIYTLATGESDGTITLNTDKNALLTGNIYYYSETEKSGCWHYENGVATLRA